MIKCEVVFDGSTIIFGDYTIFGNGDLDEVYRTYHNDDLIGESYTIEEAIKTLHGAIKLKYKHNKTGNIYELINIANECDTEKFPRMVIYFSIHDGCVYARPFDDFHNAFTFIGNN